MKPYIALIHKEPASCYGISFPDFPGCISAGDTLEEAMQMGADALGFHIRGMLEDKEQLLEPSPLERVMADPENAGALAVLIRPSMLPKGKAVRVNITMDEYLLKAIDSYTESSGKTRSAFLAEAARQVLET